MRTACLIGCALLVGGCAAAPERDSEGWRVLLDERGLKGWRVLEAGDPMTGIAWMGHVPRADRRFDIWLEQEPATPLDLATWYTSASVRDVRVRRLDPAATRMPRPSP